MLVVVASVNRVAVLAVHVVDVVAVLDLLVPAGVVVRVGMLLGPHVLLLAALVIVILVRVVDLAVVQVVDVVAMLNAGVPAGRAMHVIMVGEWLVFRCGGHGSPFPVPGAGRTARFAPVSVSSYPVPRPLPMRRAVATGQSRPLSPRDPKRSHRRRAMQCGSLVLG
jgi:hypothetical protein